MFKLQLIHSGGIMKKCKWLFFALIIVYFSYSQTKQNSRQINIFPDEYSELDDVPVSKIIDDPFITKALERARIKYLQALSYIEKKDTTRAEENFEQAIDILNSINYYPNINKYRDYTDLVQSILEDYEKYIRNIDHLDESSSLFLMRESLSKELEKTKRTKPKPQIGYLKPESLDTSKANDSKAPTYQIPMDDNEYVKKSIEFLTQKPIGRKFVRNSLARSTLWGSIIKKIIEEEAMPAELFYLAMVESGFNPFAVSRAKAVGIWQFIMQTGQLYGLNAKSSPWIDERRDPIKSTRAAMRHLRDLYNELGDWHLAIAAYNCGINAVHRAIAKFNNSDSVNFWNIMQFLPRETRNYVPLFIAVVKVVNNLDAYGFNHSDIQYQSEIEFDKYTLKEPVNLAAIAKCANTTIDQIKELNPELTFSLTPPDVPEYEIRLPYGSKQTFITNYLNLSEDEKRPFFSYRLEKKENIDQIAEKFNLTRSEILLANKLPSSSKYLPRGTVLKIPIQANYLFANKKEEEFENTNTTSTNIIGNGSSNLMHNTDETNSTNSLNVVRYIVKENDNLTKICKKYNVEPDSILAWNELKTSTLTPGQTLRIYTIENPNTTSKQTKRFENETSSAKDNTSPSIVNNPNRDESRAQMKQQSTTTKYHKVKKGETLQLIADKYNVDINQLLEWNPSLKSRKHNINVGEKIKIAIDNTKITLDKYSSKSTKLKEKNTNKYHVVRKGENLSTISKKYGISIQKLISLNPNIKPNKIKNGDKIRLD